MEIIHAKTTSNVSAIKPVSLGAHQARDVYFAFSLARPSKCSLHAPTRSSSNATSTAPLGLDKLVH